MAIKDEETTSEVYVILRVFNLGKKDMGMCVYVDPYGSKELKFTAESYSVVPA